MNPYTKTTRFCAFIGTSHGWSLTGDECLYGPLTAFLEHQLGQHSYTFGYIDIEKREMFLCYYAWLQAGTVQDSHLFLTLDSPLAQPTADALLPYLPSLESQLVVRFTLLPHAPPQLDAIDTPALTLDPTAQLLLSQMASFYTPAQDSHKISLAFRFYRPTPHTLWLDTTIQHFVLLPVSDFVQIHPTPLL